MKKISLLLLIFLFIQSFVIAQENSDIVASVNGKYITKTYVNKILQEELSNLSENQKTDENIKTISDKIINQKIEEILLTEIAKKSNIEVSNEDVNMAIDSIKSKFKTQEDFKTDLKKQGLTENEFKKEIKENIMRIKYVSNEIKNRAKEPTNEELENLYSNVISKMKGQELKLQQEDEKIVSLLANNLKRMYSEQVKIRHIFIKYSNDFTKEQKKEVTEKLKELKKEMALKDMNFAKLSVKYSDDQILRQNKGDLGFVLKEDVTPEVAKVIFGLQVGDYNRKPIQTSNGYHFFRVEEKKAKMPIEFDEIKSSMHDLLYKQNIQKEYDKLILELKNNSDIKIY